ncbi:hypothetical protein P4U99_11890, partial [Brevibacillus agri]|uniref:hypothetical protein n=4 Tax=Brevibacillus agri TaxID=51101 RepID=UPI002E2104A6|nr:hypothetical protein [Brevibacillus agri]MED1686135.1 hypothetical protein [Brevibacillus agri]MED1702589.1 hypothetical protein [Brevibacillus agri]MED1728858.1 hypothetical protein [Brevibacillus agri]MED3498305.1 hypothetical protein [Brevibacillus agri]
VFSFEGMRKKLYSPLLTKVIGNTAFLHRSGNKTTTLCFWLSNLIQKNECSNESVCLLASIVIPVVYAMLDEITIHAGKEEAYEQQQLAVIDERGYTC